MTDKQFKEKVYVRAKEIQEKRRQKKYMLYGLISSAAVLLLTFGVSFSFVFSGTNKAYAPTAANGAETTKNADRAEIVQGGDAIAENGKAAEAGDAETCCKAEISYFDGKSGTLTLGKDKINEVYRLIGALIAKSERTESADPSAPIYNVKIVFDSGEREEYAFYEKYFTDSYGAIFLPDGESYSSFKRELDNLRIKA